MSEEAVETTTPEATKEVTTEAPALTDDAVAAYLGIPVEDVGKAKNIAELYKRANATNQAAKEYERRVKSQLEAVKPSETDDVQELDTATQKALDKWFRENYGATLSLPYAQHQADIESVMGDFLETHLKDDGFNPAAVDDAIEELGLRDKLMDPRTTARQAKALLDKAYKFVKAENTDIDALVEKKLAEKLAESKEKGEEVVGIRPKNPSAHTAAPDPTDPHLTVAQRAAAVKEELAKLRK